MPQFGPSEYGVSEVWWVIWGAWIKLSPTGDQLRVQKGFNSGSPASQRGLNLLRRKLQPRVCHGWRYKPLDAFANSALYFCLRVPLFFFLSYLPYNVSMQNIPFLPAEGKGSLVGQ